MPVPGVFPPNGRPFTVGAQRRGAERGKGQEVGGRMGSPMGLLGVSFMAILVAPALLRVMGGST